ncbi:hypothetical protein D8I35_11835 [Corticibacter populi]|uniref:Invasion activity up-regulator n=1 Tax=Corticibacter populi TaxID=1550736 RepID=A0A3M6QSN8_9BURK|nr:SirB2 family protein [Corticibacter populi]RMX06050.1 hypothetical protein D8I35_11835 [Corticibacter populi]RZS30846.1 putative membrane protein SirB2 [Corticibacter populi]
MIAHYLLIKHAHMGLALLSGALFALRGGALLLGMAWPRRRSVRALSYAVDTALLLAAFTLVTMLPAGYFANGWLLAKLVLLPFYIGLGFAALRTRRRGMRALLLVLALLVFAQIYGIARAHHPLGWLVML